MNPVKHNQTGYASAIFYTVLDSPVGKLLVASTSRDLIRIGFANDDDTHALSTMAKAYPQAQFFEDEARNRHAIAQLQSYFDGSLREFSLDFELHGTEFQKSVWEAVACVPYGQTRSYGDIAREIGRPDAVRAVGRANGANPIPIVIPCHRIIGSDGSMTGFGGGIPLKRKLLKFELGSNFGDQLNFWNEDSPSNERR